MKRKTMTFLVNPSGKRAARKRRTKTTRKPPKGFRTWKAYMASIRPNAKGGTVATRRKRRRSTSRRRRRRNPSTVALKTNPRRRRRRSYRRNPRGFSIRGIGGQVMNGAVGAVQTLAGKAGVRIVRGFTPYTAGSAVGTAVEGVAAIGLGMFASRMFGPKIGERVMIGGFQAPIEAFVKQMGIPYVSEALGDDGISYGTYELGAYPSDIPQLGGYVGSDGVSDDEYALAAS